MAMVEGRGQANGTGGTAGLPSSALPRVVEWKVNGVSQKTWTLDWLSNDLAAASYNAGGR